MQIRDSKCQHSSKTAPCQAVAELKKKPKVPKSLEVVSDEEGDGIVYVPPPKNDLAAIQARMHVFEEGATFNTFPFLFSKTSMKQPNSKPRPGEDVRQRGGRQRLGKKE